MEIESNEKKRASNIIWNTSCDYSFDSEIMAFDENGKADLYMNYIIGAVHKYYDYARLESFFTHIKNSTNHELLEELAWIGLENCAFNKGKNERFVLKNLRQNYSKKFLEKYDYIREFDFIDEIKIAHFKRVLGENTKMTKPVRNILDDLEFDEYMDTEQIISKLNKIIRMYFQYKPICKEERNISNRPEKSKSSFQIEYNYKDLFSLRNSFFKHPSLISLITAVSSSKIYLQENIKIPYNEIYQWLKSISKINKDGKDYMEGYYGASIIQDSQLKFLEKILCIGNHKNCHLHFTRGNFDDNIKANKNEVNHRNDLLKQNDKNKLFYNGNYARNNNNILKLTSKIRNTMLVNFDTSYHSVSGKFVAVNTWRNLYLYDNRIFMKNCKNDIGNLTVDIMLDASSSQIDRQEIVATEGYIIAESLTRCKIPVKVYSFCSTKDYTIINLFRDYNEIDSNEKIFEYNCSGCNRDGLAIRTSLHMMKNSTCEHKILIVLSDGKPYDTYEYADQVSVNDTALEVRKGLKNGISIIGVFTGSDRDVPDARKIYGHNLAYIKSTERFADTVGVILENELKNF